MLNSKYNYKCGENGNTCSEASTVDETYEFLLWKQKRRDNNITLGVITVQMFLDAKSQLVHNKTKLLPLIMKYQR